MNAKNTYEIVTRDSSGGDTTLVVKGDRTKLDSDGRLTVYDGGEIVFTGISIVRFVKK